MTSVASGMPNGSIRHIGRRPSQDAVFVRQWKQFGVSARHGNQQCLRHRLGFRQLNTAEQAGNTGVIQRVWEFERGTSVKITAAKFYLPCGTNIHGVGLESKIAIPDSVIGQRGVLRSKNTALPGAKLNPKLAKKEILLGVIVSREKEFGNQEGELVSQRAPSSRLPNRRSVENEAYATASRGAAEVANCAPPAIERKTGCLLGSRRNWTN